MTNTKTGQVWLIGGGIAALASAVFLIRDAGIDGKNIQILEELNVEGGSLDGAASPVGAGYVTRGGRMLEEEAYQCLWNLLETIPSMEDPNVSVRQEILDFNAQVRTDARARLIDEHHHIIEASDYGLDTMDRLELVRLLATPEHALGARRIDEIFSDHFFQTNFWQMWRTTFAFQNWHSAVELKRYFLRFIQEFPRIHTLSGVRRTRYNQYDSIVLPIREWLVQRGVETHLGTRVTDIDFVDAGSVRRHAVRLHVEREQRTAAIELDENDVVMVTLGSITASASYGGNDSAPVAHDREDGSWLLWGNIARKAADFGRPGVFCDNVDASKWHSFTLTMHGGLLLKRIVEFSGNEPGTGALMTFVKSGWLMSIVVPHQPHFPDMPQDTFTLWGYGLFVDAKGDYVKKPMAQCSGKEVLTELIHHLGFSDVADDILASTDVTSVMMPYASAVFCCRDAGDRPLVIPHGAANFAFLGQFVEMPEDTVFTVEYSVRSAMTAVYGLFGVDKPVPPIYHGLLDPKVGLQALEAAFR
ncbi:oleate hydratase [Ochrobactrum sp. POC9]|uniref:oleate hydratase n=1 Tax=Ochrobactrum sp. POC9 TaxID=2203419 RepID=UPI001AED005E|nr:oleate hydratase [Ochrobactrum sp. POC9]